jgi:hypothetical protein
MNGLVVLFFPVGGEPEAKTIGADLASWQALVGGYLQELPLNEAGHRLLCNEEGLLRKLPPNREVPRWSTIRGPFFITRFNAGGLRPVSLTTAEAEHLTRLARNWPLVATGTGDRRKAVRP